MLMFTHCNNANVHAPHPLPTNTRPQPHPSHLPKYVVKVLDLDGDPEQPNKFPYYCVPLLFGASLYMYS